MLDECQDTKVQRAVEQSRLELVSSTKNSGPSSSAENKAPASDGCALPPGRPSQCNCPRASSFDSVSTMAFTDEGTPLASLSLTHVHYNPDDLISYVCAWLALVPQGLCVVYVTLIWATREVEIGLMFGGQMACEALNWGLKRWIKEERPRQMYGKGYGMPSSHAQFVAYFAVSLALFLLLRHRPSASTTHTPLTLPVRGLLAMTALLGAAGVAASRVYLNYHTPKQVLVGCLAGVLCALAWFVATAILRRSGLLEFLLDSDLAKMLRMRDLVVEEDLVDAGWERWEGKRKRRRAAGTGNGPGKKAR